MEHKYLKKIPNEILEYIRTNKSVDYIYEYDDTKELEDQNLHIDTIAILTYINMEYLIDAEQKIEMQKILRNDIKVAEEEKRKLYNSNIIFRNNIKNNYEKLSLVSPKSEKCYKK